jgi:hypothetical protein
MKMRYGFKLAAVNAMDGWADNHIDPLINAGIPPVVMSIDSAGPVYEAQQKMSAWPLDKRRSAALVYRHSEFDIPEYQLDPKIAAEHQWNYHVLNWPKELDKQVVWFGIVNEPAYVLGDADLPQGGGPYRTKFTHNGLQVWDNAEWLAVHAYRLAELAVANGIRLHLLGWSAGTPEPFQWKGMHMTKLLNVMRARPDDLALDLHEGSMDADSLEPGVPYLIGRFRNIPQPWPSIFVTEFGWALDDAPIHQIGVPQLEVMYREQYAYPQVKGLAIWALAKGPSWGDIGQTINGYMQPLTQRILAVDVPPLGEPTDPPPVDPPNGEPLPMTNLLKNPSFENGWTDATAFPGHIPAEWDEVVYLFGDEFPNPYGQPYKNGEAVKKHKGNLPPAEQSVFVWDGDWTYKIFGGGTKSFWFEMTQDFPAAAGTYRLTTPVWVDHYHWKGYKDYNVDPNQAQIAVWVNGDDARPWTSLKSGQKHDVVTEFSHPGGALVVTVGLRSNWDINGNFWLDGLSLVAVTEPPDPPTPPDDTYLAIVVKAPQQVTAAEWQTIAAEAYKNLHDMTASHDTMLSILERSGRMDSYVKVAYPERQADVIAMIEAAGYSWKPLWEVAPPFPLRHSRSTGRGL